MADADVLEKSQVFLGEENVPWKDEEEVIPFDIYTACSLGEHNFVRVLLSKGMSSSELNSCNCGGWTALMYAAYVGHDNVVNLLLDADVNVNVKSRKSGSTPLMLAASCGNESVAYFLLQSGADIDAQDRQGWTALYYATHQGHQNVVKLLIENGANKELRENRNGLTPLLAAAKGGQKIVFKLILQSGANRTARTSQGESLRELALRHGHISIVNIFDQAKYKYVPQAMLRSEAVLDDVPSQRRSQEFPGYHDNRLHSTHVQDGPEAIEKLIHQNMETRYQPSPLPVMISRGTGQASTPQPIPGASPRHTPDAQTPVGSIGSPEDCFVDTACTTMRSRSLQNRLEQISLEGKSPCAGSPINQGLDQHNASESSSPLARFLLGLNLGKYLAVFEQEEFDFELFLTLDDAQLREMGILLGPRKKILSAIDRWKNKNRQWQDQGSEKELITNAQQARDQLHLYRMQLSQEREIMQNVLQDERAVREQLYDMAKGAQFELQKAASSMATLRGLTGKILKKLNSDDTLRETGEKLSSVMENSTENIYQALQRVERILGGNPTTLQLSSDSSELPVVQ